MYLVDIEFRKAAVCRRNNRRFRLPMMYLIIVRLVESRKYNDALKAKYS